MSSVVVGFLLALGVGAWTFNKAMRRTGDNTQSSLILAGVVGFIAFAVGVMTMAMINSLVG